MRQHFHAARRGSQSAYKARPAAPDCNGRVQVHRERGRFKLATLKAIRELTTARTATPRQRRGEVIFQIGGEAAGIVNTDISGSTR
jgi:hypothetical protein